MELILTIAGGFLSFIASVVSGVILYRTKRLDSKLDQHAAAIALHSVAISGLEKTAVTDGHVRAIFREEIQTIAGTVQKIDANMTVVLGYMSEQRGYEKAKAEAAAERNRRSTD